MINNENQVCIAQNIYLTGGSDGNARTAVILAMMDMLSGHIGLTGFFRPIVASDQTKDNLITLIQNRYQLQQDYQASYGCTIEQAHKYLLEDKYDELLKIILAKYRHLKDQCDHVLCVGAYDGHSDALLEFDFDANVANNLDCVLLPVLSAGEKENEEILDNLASLKHALHEQHCTLLCAVIHSVRTNQLAALRIDVSQDVDFPVYLIPYSPVLEKPTLNNIVDALGARVFSGNQDTLNREVFHYKVAAMLVPDFLDYVEDGDLIITPGDRADIILACLMTYYSQNYPQIAGLILTGSMEPGRQVQALLEHNQEKTPFAILAVDCDTFSAAMKISQVKAKLEANNKRKIAHALGLVESNINILALKQRLCSKTSNKLTPLMFEYDLVQRAKAKKQHIVLPEGKEERILRAAEILLLRDVVKITLLGDEEVIWQKIQNLGLKLYAVDIIDPLKSPLRAEFAEVYYQARKHKNLVYDTAYDLMADVSYFGTLMIHLGLADGMVSGAVHSTQHTIRPAFEIIKTKPGASIVSSVFFMCLADRVLVYGDCAVNPNPNAQELADIAINAAETAQNFNIVPRVAMLSYSTGDSGKGEAVDKVREAVKIAKTLRPDLMLEGPMQYDAAVDPDVAKTKLPDSEVAGQATVFIFPDLNTGNNTYKAVQRSSGAIAIGPILQGLNKPVNDLSRGCTVTEIVNTVIITAIQAQESFKSNDTL